MFAHGIGLGIEFLFIVAIVYASLIACFLGGLWLIYRSVLPCLSTQSPHSARPASRMQIGRLLIGLGLVGLPVLLFVAQPDLYPASRVEERDRITIGMSIEEVKQILGNPVDQMMYEDNTQRWQYDCDWMANEVFFVAFGEDGHVIERHLFWH